MRDHEPETVSVTVTVTTNDEVVTYELLAQDFEVDVMRTTLDRPSRPDSMSFTMRPVPDPDWRLYKVTKTPRGQA